MLAGNTGVGNVGFCRFTVGANGGVNAAMPNELLNVPSVSWYRPTPPRTAVRPLPPTSHAKPRRGAKLWRDGLTNGPPTTVDVLVARSGRYASKPFRSDGTE